jgi:hypothetical protein
VEPSRRRVHRPPPSRRRVVGARRYVARQPFLLLQHLDKEDTVDSSWRRRIRDTSWTDPGELDVTRASRQSCSSSSARADRVVAQLVTRKNSKTSFAASAAGSETIITTSRRLPKRLRICVSVHKRHSFRARTPSIYVGVHCSERHPDILASKSPRLVARIVTRSPLHELHRVSFGQLERSPQRDRRDDCGAFQWSRFFDFSIGHDKAFALV